MITLIAILFAGQLNAAVESRAGFNLLDSPRTFSDSDLKASRDNFEVEVIIPFHRFIVGMAFENYRLKGQIQDESATSIDLNFNRTAALIGYRFGIGQYGYFDVTNDIMISFGFIPQAYFVESTKTSSEKFNADLASATSVYYLGTYGYGSIITGIKFGFQSTNLKNFKSASGNTRSNMNLSSPFMGLSIGFFL